MQHLLPAGGAGVKIAGAISFLQQRHLQVLIGGAITFFPYRWCRLACNEVDSLSAEREWASLWVNYELAPEGASDLKSRWHLSH